MRVFPVVIALGVLIAGVAGCGGPPGGSQGGSQGEKATSLTVGAIAEPANLDFTSTEGAAIPQILLVNVYEGLVKLDQNGEIVPLLAEKWDVSEDRKTYTFHLKQGVKFSNGQPFTADDAVFSLRRFDTWKLKIAKQMDVIDSVQKKSDTEVEVELKRPSNGWLYAMTSRLGAMFSRTGVDDLANKPIGTGPYKLASWKRGDAITLTANAGYHGRKPALSTVIMKYFKDPTSMNNAQLTGVIDVISSVQSPDSLGQFSDRNRFQVIEGGSNGEVVLSMNNKRAPFDDKKVRQAVRYALNRDELLKTAWAGRGTLIGSMVPTTDPWYEDRTGDYPFDQQKAKDLLGGKTYDVKMRVPSLPYAIASAQVVKSQLGKVGINVEIEQLEFPARWLDLVFNKGDYDMSIINHVEPRDMSLFADPEAYFHYDSAAYRRLLDEADQGTEQEQTAKMKQAAKLLSEDAAADFLFLFPNLIVADKGVTGLPKNAVSESFDMTGLAKQ